MINIKKSELVTTSALGFDGRANTIYYMPKQYPHSLIIGRTGSGKTYGAKSWIYRFLINNPTTKLFLLDPKHEFGYDNCNLLRYYSDPKTGIFDGLATFFDTMYKRMQGEEPTKIPCLLYVDELSILTLNVDKKLSEKARLMLSQIYMLSRSLNMYTITGIQRPDASNWSSGARDNISLVVVLGDVSKETCEMFSLDKSHITSCPYPGMGHLFINGSPDSLMKIRTLSMPSTEEVDRVFKTALDRL